MTTTAPTTGHTRLVPAPILPFLEPPGRERLTAVLEGVRVPLAPRLFDRQDPARLHGITEKLLAGLPR